jgi:hypothetical protein
MLVNKKVFLHSEDFLFVHFSAFTSHVSPCSLLTITVRFRLVEAERSYDSEVRQVGVSPAAVQLVGVY